MPSNCGSKSSPSWGNRPAATHANRVWELTDAQTARHSLIRCSDQRRSEMLHCQLPFPLESTEKAQPRLCCSTHRSVSLSRVKGSSRQNQDGAEYSMGNKKPWGRATNSVASKEVSMGSQKCWGHSLHPEKECSWKTAEDRHENVL